MNLGEPGPTWDGAEQSLSGRYAETIGIVRVKRHGRAHDGASFLSGDDSLDGVLAHLRGIGWSLLVTAGTAAARSRPNWMRCRTRWTGS